MKLIDEGKKFLLSQYENNDDKKAVDAKIKNISDKTGKYFVPETLFQERTSRKNRVLMPFEHIVSNNITFSQLETFLGGVTVEFVNNEYFDQLKLSNENQNEVFKKLKNKLGSDDLVSAMIDIRSTGSSSSQVQRDALKNLDEFLKTNGKKIDDVLIKRKSNIKYSGCGNDIWEGYVYYNIRGGQQNSINSHVEHHIKANNVHLFNPSVEYADKNVADDITLVLLYFAFHSIELDNRGKDWVNIINKFNDYFKKKIYDTGSLFDYVTNHISLNIEKGILYDPIRIIPIKLEMFCIKKREDDSLDITHQESVYQRSYIYDKSCKKLLTPARPTNLFWSTHLSNMMQQDFSLSAYFDYQREIIKMWDRYDIDKLLKG